MMEQIIYTIPGLYRVIPLQLLRKTAGVDFDYLPGEIFTHIDSIDRVIHETNALSPGSVGNIERPWYMHPDQDDNLMVLHGVRNVDIFTKKHGKVEHFEVSAEHILHNGNLLYEGGAMLVWPRGVFHRIQSGAQGSASVNFAVHYAGYDIRSNFNIYELNTETGDYKIIREGYLDQPNS
jgi:hypothetical protein